MSERRYSDNWMPDWLHLLTCAFCRRVRAEQRREHLAEKEITR